MISVENAKRTPAPEWAVWSLMTSLYMAAGQPAGAEGSLAMLVGAVVSMPPLGRVTA
jgi:hypothetical protein